MQRKHRIESYGFRYGYLIKPRQFGFTTDYAIDMLDDACFVPGASSGILAHDRQTLGKIFQIIKRAYENMPNELKPETQYDTRNEYKFIKRFDGLPLDNELYVALDIRGSTIQRLHVSESAYIKNRDELKMGAKQAVPITGRITEETTGNGMNELYDDVMVAIEKQQKGQMSPQDYRVYFYAWFENPEYTLPGTLPEADVQRYGDEEILRNKFQLTDGQLLWRRWKLDEMRSQAGNTVGLNVFQRFRQEYPATLLEAFQSGVGNVFELDALMEMQAKVPFDPLTANRFLTQFWDRLEAQEQEDVKASLAKFKALHATGVMVWHFPEKGKHYVIGVDPSDGEGSDNTSINVWEIPKEATEKLKQCAQFYGKIRPDHGAQIAMELAEYYNKAFVGVENNMLSFVLFLSKIYDNYYTEVEMDKKTQRRSVKLGWNTNTKTRDPMVDDFIALHEDNYLEINSAITISEMKTFVKKDNGKREHADGKHDDSLIGDMIALQMRKYEPKHGRTFTNKPAGF